MASISKHRNSALPEELHDLLAEVCVHSSNAVILTALRNPDPEHRQYLTQQIEDLMMSYLELHIGDQWLGDVMKVMMCPHCQSDQLSKNGYR
jgi:hypothetical protein